MKKHLFLPTALLLTLALGSCSQNDELTQPEINKSSVPTDITAYARVNEPQVVNLAHSVSRLATDLSFVQEVHQNVLQSISYGLDEVYYFKEIEGLNKKISGSKKSVVSSKLRSATNYETLMAQVKSGDFQIYWPYSENWDGKSFPAISFVSKDNGDEAIPALIPVTRNGKLEMDTIIIDEKYAENNPVWIIRRSDIDYNNLPDFSKGEFVKNNVMFSTAAGKLASGQQNVYTMKLGRFMSSKHYDPWTKGGSEFMIYITETAVNTQLPGSPADLGATTQVNAIFVDRPRKTINKKQWVDVNAIGVSNWRPEVHKTTFVIMEKDWGGISGGTKENIPYDIPVTGADGKMVNIKGNITVLKEDDHVVTRVYDRNYIFSNLNFSGGQWTIYNNNNGVNWTLPTVIGQTNL